MVVGNLFSCWEGNFSGAMLPFGRVYSCFFAVFTQVNIPLSHRSVMGNASHRLSLLGGRQHYLLGQVSGTCTCERVVNCTESTGFLGEGGVSQLRWDQVKMAWPCFLVFMHSRYSSSHFCWFHFSHFWQAIHLTKSKWWRFTPAVMR